MRGHTDLRRGQIERDLDYHDEGDISEPFFRERRAMMAQQKSGPRADHAHDATGSANYLSILYNLHFGQSDHSCSGGQSGTEVACEESNRADRALERRTENVKGENVKGQMQKAAMQKERSEQPPVLMLCKNYHRF